MSNSQFTLLPSATSDLKKNVCAIILLSLVKLSYVVGHQWEVVPEMEQSATKLCIRVWPFHIVEVFFSVQVFVCLSLSLALTEHINDPVEAYGTSLHKLIHLNLHLSIVKSLSG